MLYIDAVITRTTTKKNINNMMYSQILHIIKNTTYKSRWNHKNSTSNPQEGKK